jgi:hypothetical protein
MTSRKANVESTRAVLRKEQTLWFLTPMSRRSSQLEECKCFTPKTNSSGSVGGIKASGVGREGGEDRRTCRLLPSCAGWDDGR